MGSNSDNTQTTVDLYVSAGTTASWDRQQSVIDSLEQHEREGTIDHYRVQVWGRRVSLSGPMSRTRFHRAAVETAREFEQWAERADRSVELPFDRQEVSSELTGGEFHLMRPPVICLAVYVDEELSIVAPCQIGDEQCSVEDVLDRLAGEADPAGSLDRDRLASGIGTADTNP